MDFTGVGVLNEEKGCIKILKDIGSTFAWL